MKVTVPSLAIALLLIACSDPVQENADRQRLREKEARIAGETADLLRKAEPTVAAIEIDMNLDRLVIQDGLVVIADPSRTMLPNSFNAVALSAAAPWIVRCNSGDYLEFTGPVSSDGEPGQVSNDLTFRLLKASLTEQQCEKVVLIGARKVRERLRR